MIRKICINISYEGTKKSRVVYFPEVGPLPPPSTGLVHIGLVSYSNHVSADRCGGCDVDNGACVNMGGDKFRCQCNKGFILQSDRRSCKGLFTSSKIKIENLNTDPKFSLSFESVDILLPVIGGFHYLLGGGGV